MASTGAALSNNERKLLNAISKYDVEKLLSAASTSIHRVISATEKKEIVESGQSSQKRLCESFVALILENGRTRNFARFILEYNRPSQDAALAVLNPTGRIPPPPTGSACSSSDYSQDGQDSSTSRTPPSPMDIDTKDHVYSQVNDTDTPTTADRVPDDGYYTLSRENISQEMARLSISNRSNQIHEEKPTHSASAVAVDSTDGKKRSRKHTRRTKYRSTDDCTKRKKSQIPLVTPLMSHHDVEYDAACYRSREIGKSFWPSAHFEVIIQNLNMDALLPHALKNRLLTRDEYEMIDSLKGTPRKQNRYFLLNVLPRKGETAHQRFLDSLKAEKEHLGHEDLVQLLSAKNDEPN